MEQEILELLTGLAEAGDAEAMEQAADYYFYKTNKQRLSDEEFDRIWSWYHTLAEQGNGHAMAVVGAMYYEGVNIKQDYTKARQWYERAAAAGDVWGINNLGYCYYYGREVDVDDQKAWTYFGRAAALGNHCGMYKIGDMYYHGRYVGQDFKKAVYWYRKAISLIDEDCPEYPNIAARLGHCALKGEGMEKDVLCALKWLQAAEYGCYQFLLRGDAFAHLSFPGVKEDLAEARALLETAIAGTRSVVQYT